MAIGIRTLVQVAAVADEAFMSTSAALSLLVLVTVAICLAGSVVIGRARRGARGTGGDDLASREGTHRLLTENWVLVEQTARETGMSEDEIARVRANLLGLDKG
jgi:uncharacterized protein HemX